MSWADLGHNVDGHPLLPEGRDVPDFPWRRSCEVAKDPRFGKMLTSRYWLRAMPPALISSAGLVIPGRPAWRTLIFHEHKGAIVTNAHLHQIVACPKSLKEDTNSWLK